MFGEFQFGRGLFGGHNTTGYTACLANVSRYRLVLYDSDATTVLYYLPIPHSASWFRRISEPSSLTLRYATECEDIDFSSGAFDVGHWVKIFDENNNVLDSLRITASVQYFGNDYADIECEGVLAGLTDQFVNEKIYLAADNWTLDDVIVDLLGEQQSSPITVNLQYINASIGDRSIGERTYKRQSILEILQALVKEFGGYLLCDAKGGLRWYATATDWRYWQCAYPVTSQPKHYLRSRKNILAATIKQDRSKMATRLYAIGAWETVHLPTPGYIEDASAISTYGFLPRFVQNPEAKTDAELLEWATNIFSWYTVPRLELEITAIDLTMLPESTDYRHIHLGHIACIEIPEKAITTRAPIYEITVDLCCPEKINIKLAPLCTGDGMPELAGLSQQPYPINPVDFLDSVSAGAASYDPTPTRRMDGLYWLRYTAP